MSKRAKKQIQFPVTSSEELDSWIDKSDKILVVLDVHDSWCGPCVVIQPLLEQLTIDLDAWESRIKFLTVDTSMLTPRQREMLPKAEGCKPFFAVCKHKVVIGKIIGVNAPELRSIIDENIFPAPDKD